MLYCNSSTTLALQPHYSCDTIRLHEAPKARLLAITPIVTWQSEPYCRQTPPCRQNHVVGRLLAVGRTTLSADSSLSADSTPVEPRAGGETGTAVATGILVQLGVSKLSAAVDAQQQQQQSYIREFSRS